MQTIPLNDLEMAWDVNVPGLGKRNRLATLDIPNQIAPTETLIRKSIGDQCRMMLKPPVSMVGIPAMQKVAREMANWPEELGMDKTRLCLRQVREYLNSPPDIMGNHLTAGRDIWITFLEQAGAMANLDLSEATYLFRAGMAILPEIAEAIQQEELSEAAEGFSRVAENEKKAYSILQKIVAEAGK